MSESVLCANCGCDCTNHHWMCDRRDGEWCGECFPKTSCGKGKHGEGCATQVFDDSRAESEDEVRHE